MEIFDRFLIQVKNNYNIVDHIKNADLVRAKSLGIYFLVVNTDNQGPFRYHYYYSYDLQTQEEILNSPYFLKPIVS